MYPPRYEHANYNLSYQGGPNGSKFGIKWPMQHRNRPPNYHSKGANNYQSQIVNEEHWCETCDRGFPNLHVLENHKKQHQKCNIDGCQFVAHPKVITKHIQMQHSTGLFKKIANLTKPEEIKKWREERKNRYPTRENIEKKTAEIKEKVDRGEKMGMKQHREHKCFKSEHGTKRKLNSGNNNNRQQFKRKFKANKCLTETKFRNSTTNLAKKPCLLQRDNKSILPINDQMTLKPFTGILHLLDENEDDNIKEDLTNSYTIEDDEYIVEESNQTCNTTSEPVVCGALSSLMCDYESSDNESTHELDPKQSSPDKLIKNSYGNNNQNKSPDQGDTVQNNLEKSDDESGPEEVKTMKLPNVENETEASKSNNNEQKQANSDIQKTVEKTTRHNNVHVHRRNNSVNFKRKLPSTLLEKLLCNEIRQERNIVLQCIRHIVKCNYFKNTVENNN